MSERRHVGRSKGYCRLVVIPSVPAWRDGAKLIFDRKFFDGMTQYVRHWPGPVACILRPADGPPPAFGGVTRGQDETPFETILLGVEERIGAELVLPGDVVLASGDDEQQLHLAALCRERGARSVYAIEYTSETRHQIVALSAANRALKARRHLHVWWLERRRKAALESCDGLQCNGTPAHEEYQHADRLLYFDTRVPADSIISAEGLRRRLNTLASARPLRLAFSGRLIAMKGADHLVRVALGLRARRVPFKLTIYGTGDLEAGIRAELQALKLDECVSMPGVVDFHDRLLPELRQDVDLFVCLHRQADPSCTYIETLSCGVPLVGYANEAFRGVLAQADVGWSAPVGDYEAVIKHIERLNSDRGSIATKAWQARELALGHDMESTFVRRIRHLQRFVGSKSAPHPPAEPDWVPESGTITSVDDRS